MSLAHASERPPPKYRERRNVRVPHESAVPSEDPFVDSAFPSEEPFEDHVAETKRHLEARTSLYLIVKDAFAGMTVGSDQFVYYDKHEPKRCLAPDVFVKDDASVVDFDSWKVWERGTPHLAVEIVSDSDRLKLTWEEKFERYKALGIRELVRFDALAQEPITVWDRVGDTLVKRAAPSPLSSYECRTLGAYWTVETSSDFGKQLRLSRDREGKLLLPTPSEKALQLAQDAADDRHARAVAEHARMIAEHARQLAEQKQQDEADARKLAEQKQQDEANARKLAEQKRRDEARARKIAEQRQQYEAKARRLAEQKQRDAEAERAAALGEIERLRAELERLRATVK